MIFFILNIIQFSGLTSQSANGQEAVYTSAEMAAKAVDFINDKYKAGEKIDGYTAYVLAMAGQDLSSEKWSINGTSLRSEIENLADLMGNNVNLINYVCLTQNNDGSFGPYANEYGTKVPLQALSTVKEDITVGSDVYNQVQSAIDNAVNFFKTKYQNGGMTYDVNGWSFDYRCVEALAKSGEDLSVGGWVYNGVSLKDSIMLSANSTARSIKKDSSVQDAVYLSKELTALYAVDKASTDIDVLAGAITAKQNGDGSFGTNMFDHIMVLNALGKAGSISNIDQTKAFNFIDNLKEIHKNSWGQDAGVAWGSQYTSGFEESDTTAQVITALSYFSEAKNEGSDVYKTIQGGLTYLNDVQDADTAAIVRIEGDSTFSSAETLLALKSLGYTFDQYTGTASKWVKNSRTKTITQCIEAVNKWGDAGRLDRLIRLLADRQKAEDPGKGSFENSVYSDMWAYLALGEAGKLDGLNTGDAKTYILSKQDTSGSWGEIFDQYYPDFLSTAQAIRSLSYLPEAGEADVQAAINKGLNYLKTLQGNEGSVCAQYDDPAVDNSELIITLNRLNIDPQGAEWTKTVDGNEFTPVSYLMNNTMNADGSFGASKNVFGATEALYAYLIQDGTGNPGEGGSGGGSSENRCSVNIAIVGKDDEIIYRPGSVILDKTSKWGITAMGALHATGLSYVGDSSFVKSIDGLANSGMNGWMYSVNGVVPMTTASDKVVKEGDRVIWWYSTDMNSSGPSWDSLLKGSAGAGGNQSAAASSTSLIEQNKELPDALQVSEKALAALEQIALLLNPQDIEKENTLDASVQDDEINNVIVVGSRQPLNLALLKTLKKELDQNEVQLTQKVEADSGAVLLDAKEELALVIPAKSLNKDMEINVKEAAAGNQQETAAPSGFRQVSAIYDFGPKDTVFTMPATLTFKLVMPPLVKPDRLVLAYYDKVAGKWVSVPAVVDLDKGLVLTKLRHLGQYAVFARESLKTFADVNETSSSWAKDYIENLAGAGIVDGIDATHFEPSRKVTRAELTSLLVKALGISTDQSSAISLKDVQADDWYAGAVGAAQAAGLITGYEDGTFRPGNTVSREELAVILVRAMKLESDQEKMWFADIDKINSWARDSVFTASSKGLIKGFPDGTFRPDVAAGRDECAVIIFRMLNEY
jgi:hypothetical protein